MYTIAWGDNIAWVKGHSETSNDQALLNPFDHNIKMKAYMRVGGGGGGTLFSQHRLSPTPPPPPPPQANIDYVHKHKIGEKVSSILLKGFQKLQIMKLGSKYDLLDTPCILKYKQIY